uniref:BED-type domain-containing protein n=1 Tax=Meloidogyne javanica TaxID=6303 RepID=A0A915MTW0_MELJA
MRFLAFFILLYLLLPLIGCMDKPSKEVTSAVTIVVNRGNYSDSSNSESGPKYSPVWNHFNDIGNNRVECKYCSSKMTFRSMQPHIRLSHKEVYEKDNKKIMENFTPIKDGKLKYVVPPSQGYDQYLSAAEYEHQTQNAIEESVRQMPRGRGGPIIRERGEQSRRGKEKVIEASSDSD